MPPSEQDWGPIFVRLAAVYGFRPWDVEGMSEVQVKMYLDGSGSALLMKALPQLQANFAQLDEEARRKLIADADKPSDPQSVDSRAWRVFIRNYQTDSEEAEKVAAAERLPLSRGAAAAIVNMVESGELTREYDMGSFFWRLKISPIWKSLLSTADQKE